MDFFQDQAWNLLRAISDGEISTVASPDCWGGKQKNPTRLVVEPNPSEKICSSNWILSPNFRGDFLKKKDELPPPRISSIMKTWIFGMLPATFGCFFWYPRSQGGKKKRQISEPSTLCYYCFKQHRLHPKKMFPSLTWLPKP